MVEKISSIELPNPLQCLFVSLADAGAKSWLVGGCVRDMLTGAQPKDWDIEVYQLTKEMLEQVLANIGPYEYVGRHFGVFKLWTGGLEIDVALPRKETKSGQGHRAFDVQCDPFLSPEKASERRDFSINAMMYDPLQGELLDFHHGQQDLKNKILKHVSPAFVEDPLRPLRAMQFAARFALILDESTAALCQKLLPEADTLPIARIWQEWLKWTKAEYPSYGLKALRAMGWDALYPQLQALQGCPQDEYWHPEGDVWVHTCLVVDEAKKLCALRKLSEQESLLLTLASLCHDLGKPCATFTNKEQKIVSPDHGNMGVQPSLDFLHAIGAPKWLHQAVRPLVKEHTAHFSGEPTERAVKRLAQRLLPSNIKIWEALTEADACGRRPAPSSRPAFTWLEMANELGVASKQEEPIVTGKLLLEWGVQASPEMGRVLKAAYQAQLGGKFQDETSAYHWFQMRVATHD